MSALQNASDELGADFGIESFGDEDLVRAAGGIIVRTKRGSLQVAVIHRPHRGDWSFPKGKLEPFDIDEMACALREVYEETGYECEAGVELASTFYFDRKGRPKRVRYWHMTIADGRFRPNAEVDALRWLDVEMAAKMLTRADDAGVLMSLVDSGELVLD
jgi:8-oxo-dGTP diphosphatase